MDCETHKSGANVRFNILEIVNQTGCFRPLRALSRRYDAYALKALTFELIRNN